MFLIARIIAEDAIAMEQLRAVRELALPDWCIAAGFVRNRVWDHLHGIVPARLPAEAVAALAAWVERDPASHRVTVDLEAQTVAGDGRAYHFDLDDEPKAMLLEGLDAIDLTLKQRPAIEAFRARDRAARPWIYLDGA